jgi:two-component system, chemotaxis family, CheB/CheR fusion protein
MNHHTNGVWTQRFLLPTEARLQILGKLEFADADAADADADDAAVAAAAAAVPPFPAAGTPMNQTTATSDRPSGESAELNLVGIGASAGGIAALKSFFEAVPEESGIAFVVVMHLSPDYDSKLAEVLQPSVAMPVRQAGQRTVLQPNHVYVIPPDRSMRVRDGHLELAEFASMGERRAPIDLFFRTVAELHPDGIGVVLSGSGADGVVGLTAIKEHGGIILAQSPDEAEYDTMPRSAISTGLVDFVLPARELGAKVVELKAKGAPWARRVVPEDMGDEEAEELRQILTQLQASTGHDFTGYKTSTVLRRIARRVQVNQVESLSAYLDLLRRNGAESYALLKDMLISVTSFFRDSDAFAALNARVIPALYRDRPATDTVRVWVAGCATGEEAYSLGMLLREHADTLDDPPSTQVFATDLDEGAIAVARAGLYSSAIAADVSETRLARFFSREGAHYRVRRELREMVLFSPHNLLRDPPFSRLDLVSSRNLLIYLGADLQRQVLDLFRYALRPDGYLFLGSSERTQQGETAFRTVDRQHRIYQRSAVRPSGGSLPKLPLAAGGRHRQPFSSARPVNSRQALADGGLHRQALEAHAPPSILVDTDRSIVHVSETANRYLEFPIGVPTADLLKVARGELRLELRTALHEALENGEPTTSRWVTLVLDGVPRQVQLHVSPSLLVEDTPLALILFIERTVVPGTDAPDHADVDYGERDADAELRSTRDRLSEMIEISEVRQEHLKASNEELQSINEEYKSTLEELETSKEELQSINEELKTVNDELKSKVDELAHANDDLRNLMAATEIATLFLDRTLRIKRFTPSLEALVNVLPVDTGRPLEHLTHRLKYDGLRHDCEAVLESLQPVEREVPDTDGRHWLVRITPYRSGHDRVGGVVITFTEITRIRQAQERLSQSEERVRALIETTAEIVWTTDASGAVIEESPSWCEFTGQAEAQRLGHGWLAAVHPEDRAETERQWNHAVRTTTAWEGEYRLRHAESGEWRITAVRAVPVRNPDGSVREWVGMNTDVTQLRAADQALRAAKEAAERAAATRSQFLATMSHELRTPMTAVIGITELLEAEVVGPLTEEQKRHLGRIRASAWHLVAIVDEVLTYSRTEAGRHVVNPALVDALPIIREIVDLIQVEADAKGLELRLECAGDAVPGMSDGSKLRQVIVNLVGNAVKFTDRGTIVVELDTRDEQLQLRVRDTGAGIEPDRIEEMFEPFTQGDGSTTRTKGGTGLGLTVARRLARLLGGDVEAESQPGVGSTFTLRLPWTRDGSTASLVRDD